VISKRKVRQIYKILEERDVVLDNQTWNRRYREYTEKIKSGSPVEIAEVLRDLCVLRCDKDLSFGERKMFDMAQNLLVKEISVAKDIDEDKVEEDFRKILSL
ncbi:CarD family transcriptional regulator, partial [Thermodesulfobacteriota bacterium]